MSEIFQIAPVPFGSLAFWSLFMSTPLKINDQIKFEKSSLMNRIILNNQGKPLMISIPIVGGRTVSLPLNECKIVDDNWKRDLTRGIMTIYQNAPYFEYFGQDILNFIDRFEGQYLNEFNLKSLILINQLVPEMDKITFTIPQEEAISFPIIDLKHLSKSHLVNFTYHHSPINWKNNEYNDLNILDLLFNDAPHMLSLLRNG